MFIRIILLLSCIFSIQSQAANSANIYKIAIAQIVQHPALDQTRKGIIDSLNNGFCKINKCIISFDDIQGNISLANQVAKKYIANKVDIAVALGTPVAQVLKNQLKKSNTLVVFSSITDPVDAGLVKNLNTPEGKVTGVSNFIPIKPQLEYYKSLIKLKKLGIIFNPSEANSVKLNKLFIDEGKKMGIEVKTVAALKSSEVSTAARKIAPQVDAIIVTNDNTALSAFPSIVQVGKKFRKPVFVSDIDMMSKGASASIGPDQYELGKQTGRMIVRLLNGSQISETPIEFPKVINKEISPIFEINLSNYS